MRSRERCR
jgi:hypothetical protein